MNVFLTLACLFFIGSVTGWVIELLFRNIVHHNKKWVNPGFCTGPYLPIYGFGLCTLYLLANLEQYGWITDPVWNKIVLFIAMAIGMTLIEYIAGLFCLKYFKVMLWDYSNLWGNIQGLICPLFSFFWALLGAVYYFFVHPYVLGSGLAVQESGLLLLHRHVLRRLSHRCVPFRQSGGQAQGLCRGEPHGGPLRGRQEAHPGEFRDRQPALQIQFLPSLP